MTMNPQSALKGKKVYILGAAAIVYGLSMIYTGEMSADESFRWMWTGGVAMAGRAAVSKLIAGLEQNGGG
jgi:hypothetical protein